MVRVIGFQIVILLLLVSIWFQFPLHNIPDTLSPYTLQLQCILVATLGGNLYCFRAIYLNKSVRKNWDPNWEIWYFIRPFSSAISGFVAYIFMKAGLLVLESAHSPDANNFGFLALAFIAGLNVDRFLQKIEDIARATFGIKESRSSKPEDADDGV